MVAENQAKFNFEVHYGAEWFIAILMIRADQVN